ncbi:DsbA family protein [Salinibacter altiplanensis]|uniref:DsbA family protein n=1 Tax=Salinibacter altiplanensis TaxID=1803181 RepID=UPI00131A5FBF|nr:thioredoxin domain-containing protein [Salinibacter altiplanensis]
MASEPVEGNPEAEVLLTEFFDPNCPHCQRFKPIMEEIMAEYKGQVRYYKQPVPLWQYSRPQIRALLIAKEKGKYYKLIDQQLENPAEQGGLSREQILAQAKEAGIDRDWLAEQIAEGAKQEEVNRLPYEARQAGIESTPTLAIGTKIVGNRSAACIGQLIEQELPASGASAERDRR